jgi:hypothetical protein
MHSKYTHCPLEKLFKELKIKEIKMSKPVQKPSSPGSGKPSQVPPPKK